MRKPRLTPDRTTERTDTVSFGERREITSLSYDLIGSTQMLLGSDLEAFGETIARFQELAGGAIRAKGGFVRQGLGDDGGMAFFGYPDPTEGNADAAIRAALEIVAACHFGEFGDTALQVRIGIATAEVVIDRSRAGAGPAIVGLAPTLAARLQAAAPANRIWVCDRTRQLAGRRYSFKEAGPVALKGLGSDRAVWEVGRQSATPRLLAMGRPSTRLVGRDAELERLLALWHEVRRGRGRVVLIEGEAGIGKSRFAFEFLRAIRTSRDRTFIFQCSSHGGDQALGPIADAMRAETARQAPREAAFTASDVARVLEHAGIHEAQAADAFAFALGASSDTTRSQEAGGAAQAQARFMEAVKHCAGLWCNNGPLVVVVEDVHWIDPSSRRLIEGIAEWIGGMPFLLLLTSRANLRWPARDRCVSLKLRRLRTVDAARLAAQFRARHGAAQLPPEALEFLFARAKGVPLFIEEMLQAADSPASGEAGTPAQATPARSFSLEHLLSSRLASFGAAKHVAQAAAVLGDEFNVAMLAEALLTTSKNELLRLLGVLVRANILTKRRSTSEASWSFRHGLFQEVFYRTLLRNDRVELHRRIFMAGVIGGAAGFALGPAALARHAEGADLPVQSAYAYIDAAKASFARSASTEARNLLRQAQAKWALVQDADQRDRLFLAIAAALGPLLISLEGNRSVEARDLYEKAVPIAQSRPRDEQAELFPIYWGWWYSGADFAIQLNRAKTFMAAMSVVDDAEPRLQANHCLWAIEFNVGRHRGCLSAVEQGLKHYDAAGGHKSLTLYGGHDPRVCGLGQAGLSLWFQGYLLRAAASVDAALSHAKAIKHVGSLAHALDIAAMLHRYRGDLPSLKSVIAQMKRLAGTHQLPSLHAKALIFDGWRLAMLGDPAQGRSVGDAGYAIQREIGTREDFPVYAGMRAEILAALKDLPAALATVDEALEEVERTQHLYWAAELYRHRAVLLSGLVKESPEIEAALMKALQVAQEQGATTLLLRACNTALSLGVWSALSEPFGPMLTSLLAASRREGEIATLCRAIEDQAAAGSEIPSSPEPS